MIVNVLRNGHLLYTYFIKEVIFLDNLSKSVIVLGVLVLVIAFAIRRKNHSEEAIGNSVLFALIPDILSVVGYFIGTQVGSLLALFILVGGDLFLDSLFQNSISSVSVVRI